MLPAGAFMILSPEPAQKQNKSPSQRAFALFTTDPSGFFRVCTGHPAAWAFPPGIPWAR